MDNQELQQRNIIISEVALQDWGLKIKDEKGLVYNISSTKKDGSPTVAYQAITQLPNNGMGLNKCFKFAEVPNKQGGTSRYVRIITEPVEQGQPTQYVSPKMQQAKPVTIEKENRDERIKWMNALNNACLLIANGEDRSIEELANYIYNLEPRK
jgi:hypothetical protein